MAAGRGRGETEGEKSQRAREGRALRWKKGGAMTSGGRDREREGVVEGQNGRKEREHEPTAI